MSASNAVLSPVASLVKRFNKNIREADKRRELKEISDRLVKSIESEDTKICSNYLNENVLTMQCSKLWKEAKKNLYFNEALDSYIIENNLREELIYEEWKKQIMHKLECYDKSDYDNISGITAFVKEFAESSAKVFNNIAIHFDLNEPITPCKTFRILESVGKALKSYSFVNKRGLKLPGFNEKKLDRILRSLNGKDKITGLMKKKEFTTKEILYPNFPQSKKISKREVIFYKENDTEGLLNIDKNENQVEENLMIKNNQTTGILPGNENVKYGYPFQSLFMGSGIFLPIIFGVMLIFAFIYYFARKKRRQAKFIKISNGQVELKSIRTIKEEDANPLN